MVRAAVAGAAFRVASLGIRHTGSCLALQLMLVLLVENPILAVFLDFAKWRANEQLATDYRALITASWTSPA
jgi:hypothetical protein